MNRALKNIVNNKGLNVVPNNTRVSINKCGSKGHIAFSDADYGLLDQYEDLSNLTYYILKDSDRIGMPTPLKRHEFTFIDKRH